MKYKDKWASSTVEKVNLFSEYFKDIYDNVQVHNNEKLIKLFANVNDENITLDRK